MFDIMAKNNTIITKIDHKISYPTFNLIAGLTPVTIDFSMKEKIDERSL